MTLAEPVAATAPKLASVNTHRSDPTDQATTDIDEHISRRESRVVEYHHPIPEEDESAESASEPAEPLTPTSDAPVFSHPFKNDGPGDNLYLTPTKSTSMSQVDTPSKPQPAPPAPNRVPPPPPPPPMSQTATPTTESQAVEPGDKHARRGLSTRVGSFMRNKLHRTPSNNKEAPSPAKAQREQVVVKTGMDGPNEKQTLNIPKYRRLSSFTLSARNSPRTSQSNSPPSPSSPSSTVSDEAILETEKISSDTFQKGHKHSSSSTAINGMDKPRPGITWASGGKDGKKPSRFPRRRSASTEIVPQIDPTEPTVGLPSTFSKAANEGVGLKARRLSVSLPDEFVVDHCELDKEFKSSSLMPGRRGRCLGRGATAEVRIMSRKGASGEDLVAVKEFRGREKDESEEEYIQKIKSEFSIAKSLHHPNIVETVRLCNNKKRWNHVMEYCNHGELFSLVERKLFSGGPEGYYSPDDRLCFFKQLIRGVDYLHSHGIAHRDIKLENLLLDKNGHLKISDFGVAEVFSGAHPGLRASGGECGKDMTEVRLSKPGICGSLPYIAPEVLLKEGDYDPRPLDVWSCAIVYLTMTFGGCPWQAAKDEFDFYRRFHTGWKDWLAEHPDGQIIDGPDGHPKCGQLFSLINPPPIKRLMLKMLHIQPDKRITIREVLNTVCVKNINCCCPENFEDPICSIDATKCTSKQTTKLAANKKFLHHHIPPHPEKKIAKAFQHRFDMGDGWY